MTRTAVLPALLLLLGPLTVACGGDDAKDSTSAQADSSSPAAEESSPEAEESSPEAEESSPEAEPISKAEFLVQADAICATGNAELQAAAEGIPGEPTEEQITQFAEQVLVPNIQQQHDDIAALGAPEGEEEAVQAILDALQRGLDVVVADPSSLLSSDDPFEEASDLAEAYGLTACAA